jgi:TM2 domain-containing membrane protein YozV
MRLMISAVILCVLLAPLRVAAQGIGWDGRPVQPVPPAQGAASGSPPGYGPPAMFIYEEEKKSPALALLLSFLFPGVGNIYAHHAMGAVITWGLIIGGASIALYGLKHLNSDTGGGGGDAGSAFFMGYFVVTIGVFYGLFDSYMSAKDYNEELARRLGLLPMMSVTPIRVSGSNETAWGPALTLHF